MRIFLALPSYNQWYHGHCLMSVLNATSRGDGLEVMPYPLSGSLLPRVFNEAIGRSVTNKASIMAMLHADIGVEPGWLVKMVEAMQEHDADVLSAVVAIKDTSETTSTAVSLPGEPYRRLTLQECAGALPETFGLEADYLRDMGAERLLLNTGVMLMRVDRPWLRQWSGFQIRSCIRWDSDNIVVDTVSEDWDMSEQLHNLDPRPRLMATTAVRTLHFGAGMYDSVPRQRDEAPADGGRVGVAAGPPPA